MFNVSLALLAIAGALVISETYGPFRMIPTPEWLSVLLYNWIGFLLMIGLLLWGAVRLARYVPKSARALAVSRWYLILAGIPTIILYNLPRSGLAENVFLGLAFLTIHALLVFGIIRLFPRDLLLRPV
ncbi:MAG: hypothetical protein HYY50_05105 [Candidatus Kerfeldbacteria bacterium]|nr:hypothetical protein [Candidatus Kerfeldbacteria bacterium]